MLPPTLSGLQIHAGEPIAWRPERAGHKYPSAGAAAQPCTDVRRRMSRGRAEKDYRSATLLGLAMRGGAEHRLYAFIVYVFGFALQSPGFHSDHGRQQWKRSCSRCIPPGSPALKMIVSGW